MVALGEFGLHLHPAVACLFSRRVPLQVSLANSQAVIEHDPSQLNPAAVAESIDDMGFPAQLSSHSFKDVVVFIEGMTCMSCVRNIEGSMGIKQGVKFIRVSLEQNLAYVKYDPEVLSAEDVRLGIDDMGFEASLQPPQPLEVRIAVEGMTCQSCVRSIEDQVGQQEGVNSVRVSLADREACIMYQPSKTAPQKLRDVIDDMGFEASLGLQEFDELAKERSLTSSSDEESSAVIAVEGMTCQSCVKSIEGVLSETTGVISVKVSLEEKQAKVRFRSKLISAQEIAERIDDMGFEASLSQDEAVPLSKRPNAISSGMCVVSVKGMVCQSCVRNIQTMVGDLDGITSVAVSLEEEKAFVQFDHTRLSAQEITNAIDDLGFESKLLDTVFGEGHVYSVTLGIRGMHCNSCTRTIDGLLGAMAGVVKVEVSLLRENAKIVYDPSKSTVHDMMATVGKAGEFTASVEGIALVSNDFLPLYVFDFS
jgi:Cu+-exporting ATPase